MTADLVVGAERGLSPTVSSLAGAPTARDLGLVGIAGTAPLDAAGLPRNLRSGPALAFAPEGASVFLSTTGTTTDRAALPEDLARLVGAPSLVWGLTVHRDAVPSPLPRDPVALLAAARAAFRGWSPWLLDQVAATDPDRVAGFTYRAVDPSADLTPWPTGRVTALGDAVHAMPPTGGQAAATAIRDAGLLADRLREHHAGRSTLLEAVGAYEGGLQEWSQAAVRESLGPVRVVRALRRPLLRAAARPLIGAAGAVGRRRYAARS